MICGDGALLALVAFGRWSWFLFHHLDTLPTDVNMELHSSLQQAQLASTCWTHAIRNFLCCDHSIKKILLHAEGCVHAPKKVTSTGGFFGFLINATLLYKLAWAQN